MIRRNMTTGLVVLAALLAAPMAWAENLAVIVANEFYRNQPRVNLTRSILNLERDFRDSGFQVVVVRNQDSNAVRNDFLPVAQRMLAADRLAIVVSGHVVSTRTESWLLTTDAGQPDLFSVTQSGLSIGTLLEIAALKQGDALVAIADSGGSSNLGPGVADGFVAKDIPQGVTVISGNQRQVGEFLSGEALVPGRVIADAARNSSNAPAVMGFLPRSRAFIPDEAAYGNNADAVERDFWQQVQAQNDLNAYEAYLSQYPGGLFAAEARQRAASFRRTPAQVAEAAENSLNLTRDQRREIQRNLSLMGVKTGGIDGLFGRRTRRGIANWQQSIGVPPTGYLNANQVSRIEHDAGVRAEQLRQEAEQRRQEEARRDRLYWDETGATGREDGLRAYLQRYPDGLYSPQATDQLQRIERDNRRQARAEERQAWDRAVMQGTLQSYQAYLNSYPDGRFADEARARAVSLSNPETPQAVVENAKREEAALSLNGLTRQLIEAGLKRQNLDPGSVDGRFDDNTRRALRRYQRANEMPVTGYVTRQTIVRLLASAVNR
jgi:peptidoglycan hydrolase-like protein with peptidoglycan-binding domain